MALEPLYLHSVHKAPWCGDQNRWTPSWSATLSGKESFERSVSAQCLVVVYNVAMWYPKWTFSRPYQKWPSTSCYYLSHCMQKESQTYSFCLSQVKILPFQVFWFCTMHCLCCVQSPCLLVSTSVETLHSICSAVHGLSSMGHFDNELVHTACVFCKLWHHFCE